MLGSASGFVCEQAAAQTTGTATGAATIQPAGARTGTNGVNNFNVEGTANGTAGSLASFGVLDFSATAFSLGAQTVTGTQGGALILTLTESDAAFTVAGSLQFFLTTNYTTSISNAARQPVAFSERHGHWHERPPLGN